MKLAMCDNGIKSVVWRFYCLLYGDNAQITEAFMIKDDHKPMRYPSIQHSLSIKGIVF